MKKNVLALSIAAMIGGLGFAGAASAAVLPGGAGLTAATATELVLSEGGVGHMLLVPYYNVQNGNMTVLHVVNTDTVNGKAVKVRFRGAANSDDVMDFQVYMSPGDVWTAAVTADPATGVAQVQSADATCTIPALGNNTPQLFTTGRLDSISAPYKTDTVKANGTREGYVEIFNMADIPAPVAPATASDLYTLVKHVNQVAPCSTTTGAAELWAIAGQNYTAEADAAAAGFDTPTGGLMGDWYIINVPETTTFSGAATAVVAESAPGVSGRGNFVHFPQIDTAVGSPAIDAFTADPLLRSAPEDVAGATYAGPALAAGFYDLPDMSTPYTSGNTTDPLIQAAKLTSALAVTSVTNQYANDESISAKTDWVFSMPTRRYSVAANYEAVTATAGATDTNVEYRLFSNLGGLVNAAQPRTAQDEWFFAANTPIATDGSGNICVIADGQRFWDREETTAGSTTPGPVFSPRVPGRVANVALCGETSVLVFKDTGNSVLAASVARSTMTNGTYTNGWGVVQTGNAIPAPGTNVTQQGLPLMGASFIKLTNPQAAPGLSGTYGITWPHRFTR